MQALSSIGVTTDTFLEITFTFVGVFGLFVITLSRGSQPFSLFTACKMQLDRPRAIFTDMLVSSIIGTAIAVPIVAPDTVTQAVAGGLGLTGILTVYAADTGGRQSGKS